MPTVLDMRTPRDAWTSGAAGASRLARCRDPRLGRRPRCARRRPRPGQPRRAQQHRPRRRLPQRLPLPARGQPPLHDAPQGRLGRDPLARLGLRKHRTWPAALRAGKRLPRACPPVRAEPTAANRRKAAVRRAGPPKAADLRYRASDNVVGTADTAGAKAITLHGLQGLLADSRELWYSPSASKALDYSPRR